MGRTITIKLDQETKDFYRNTFLACRLQVWVDMFKELHNFTLDDDVSDLSDEEIIKRLGNKDIAKTHLSAAAYEDYLKYYDDIYVKE